jgi:hypothetical protein
MGLHPTSPPASAVVGMAVGIAAFGVVGGIIMGVLVNGMLGGYGALLAELYPARARAMARGVGALIPERRGAPLA